MGASQGMVREFLEFMVVLLADEGLCLLFEGAAGLGEAEGKQGSLVELLIDELVARVDEEHRLYFQSPVDGHHNLIEHRNYFRSVGLLQNCHFYPIPEPEVDLILEVLVEFAVDDIEAELPELSVGVEGLGK